MQGLQNIQQSVGLQVLPKKGWRNIFPYPNGMALPFKGSISAIPEAVNESLSSAMIIVPA